MKRGISKLRKAQLMAEYEQSLAATPHGQQKASFLLPVSELINNYSQVPITKETHPHHWYGETDERGFEGMRWVNNTEYGLRAYGSFPASANERNVYHICRSTLYNHANGQGFFQGPFDALNKIANTAFNRAKLYVNLLAYLNGATATNKPTLFIWLPMTKEQLQATAKHPTSWIRNLERHETGSYPHQVDYYPGLINKWLVYVGLNPHYCAHAPEQQNRAAHSQPAAARPAVAPSVFGF